MNKKLKLSVLFSLMLLSSCASYKANTLTHLSPQAAAYSDQKEGVIIACRAFTKQDCKRYLDRDVIKKGFQPIQITIKNDSNRFLIFSKNSIDLPLADAASVADTVHTSTVGRATAYGVGALFIWPLAIPAIVDGVKSSNANEQLDRDFAAKVTNDQTIIPSGQLNGLIFVPTESYRESFTLTLVDKDTKEKITFTPNVVRN